ncbi:MAG: MBL fold metallo-hydrolase, partial [Thermoplasmatota archaeon]
MKTTYLTHSCFTLEIDDKTFLFDYPSGRYITEKVRNTISRIIKGSNLYVFISHSHPDHFNTEIFELKEITEKAVFILSDDIPLALGNKKGEIKFVEPDKKYDIGGISVKTFKSNDEGVAFLIEVSGTTIYYGGDLAKWDWPEWSEEKRKSKVKVFKDILNYLKDLDIDIAFSNMD